MSVFGYDKDADGVVTVTMDMTGPVNAMNEEFNTAIAETVVRLEAEKGLRGVILASAKKTWFAGGDLKMLLGFAPGSETEIFELVQRVKAILRRLEKLPVPVVAAINGAALGGGFEIALCCNRRIVWDDRSVELGLPEVTLGLLPGGGGIVRLTHMLGLEKALPFLTEGRKLRGAAAVEAGFADEAVASLDELLPRAKAWIMEADPAEAGAQPWDRKGHRIPGGNIWNPKVAQVAMIAPHMVQAKTRGLMPAPELILEAAVEAVTSGFDAAQTVESRKFAAVVPTTQAKNMITTLFFQLNQVNGGASRPEGIAPGKVAKLGVVGAGMMGGAIAHVAASKGIEVVLKDVSKEAAEKGKAYSAQVLDKAIERGRADATRKKLVQGLIKPTGDVKDLAGCELVIEAVFEDMGLKNEVVKATEGQLAEGGVWASNTSTLPITRLAEASSKPENFIGLHFFSPAEKMPLVEIICGRQTGDGTLAKAFDFVRQIGKTPIVVNDSLGFFTSRTFGAQLSEASQLVAEGVNPVRVDNLGKAIGMPVGPLTIHDEVSQQLGVRIHETQVAAGLVKEEDDPRPEGMALVKSMVHDHNRRGKHHGDGGYYTYTKDGRQLWPKLLELYHKPEADAAIPDDDIKDRLLFSCVIEALKCLEEGVLRSVADGNVGSIMGIGAPPWTGGYLQFVNTYGLKEFAKRCGELEKKYGKQFKPPAIVKQKAKAGEVFA